MIQTNLTVQSILNNSLSLNLIPKVLIFAYSIERAGVYTKSSFFRLLVRYSQSLRQTNFVGNFFTVRVSCDCVYNSIYIKLIDGYLQTKKFRS